MNTSEIDGIPDLGHAFRIVSAKSETPDQAVEEIPMLDRHRVKDRPVAVDENEPVMQVRRRLEFASGVSHE